MGEPLTVITTVAFPSSRGKSFIPAILSFVFSDTEVVSVLAVLAVLVVVSAVELVLASVAVDVGEELEATCCVEQPPNIKAPTIMRATTNWGIFNRITSYRYNHSILASKVLLAAHPKSGLTRHLELPTLVTTKVDQPVLGECLGDP